MQVKTVFPFKGGRTYVHGTSMFDEIGALLKSQGCIGAKIDIAFRKMIPNPNCTLEIRPAQADDSVVASISRPAGDDLVICLNPTAEMAEPARIEYAEDRIWESARIDGPRITSARPSGYSDVEIMVALCKKLHQTHFDAGKRWVFSRFKGRIPLDLEEDVELRIVRTVGTRLTCSEVYTAGSKVGEIYFS